MNKVLTKIVGPLRRSFLLGRSSGDAVAEEREEVASMLILQGLHHAANALRQNRSFLEFFEIRRVILSGGPRLMRMQGGRRIGQ